MEIKPSLAAPLHKGDVVGSLSVKLDEETIAKVNLVIKEDVPRGSLFKQGLDQIRLLLGMEKS
jgi:D-alanyl-D-alanine carboxypeptidase (penicillin-binding protein 5/6)